MSGESMMKPIIQIEPTEDEESKLKFKLLNVDTSIANAIRRTILTEMEVLVLKTSLNDENSIEIVNNTSRFNNEFIKQRLSCIPIIFPFDYSDNEEEFNDLVSYLISNYEIHLNVKNDEKHIKNVTTEDFKVIDKKTGQVNKKLMGKIFKRNELTKEYILLIRLRPSLSDEIESEELNLVTNFKLSKAKENSCYNAVHSCHYKCIVDEKKASEVWKEKLAKLKEKEITEEELNVIQKDWELLDKNRIIKENEFEFTLETIGQYNNIVLIRKACKILMIKLDKVLESIISEDSELIINSNNTLENSYDIILKNEDYTIGKIIEYMLYLIYYNNEKDDSLTFCGFRKSHPHINESIIRIAFKNPQEKDYVIKILQLIVENLKNNIFEQILKQIPL